MANKLYRRIGTFVLFVSAVLVAFIFWFDYKFGNPSLHHIVFNVKAGFSKLDFFLIAKGAGGARGFWVSIAIYCILIPILAVFLLTKIVKFLRLSGKTYLAISLVSLISSLLFIAVKKDVIGYLTYGREYGDFYEKNYVDPRNVKIEFPEKKRNLVFLILESMESTYSGKTAKDIKDSVFATNAEGGGEYIKELSNIAVENINFSDTPYVGGFTQSMWTGWSIAGIVSVNCGVPLSPVGLNSYNKQFISNFLGGAVCLGDVLDDNGYKSVFAGGFPRDFGGFDNFTITHNKVHIEGLSHIISSGFIPRGYKKHWGMEDKKLFKYAENRLLELHNDGQPFAFIAMTTSTHFSDEYLDTEYCNKENYELRWQNVVSCSSRMVGEFIEWMKKQPFWENTTVVIIGDHLSMKGQIFPENSDRKIYNAFVNAKWCKFDKSRVKNRHSTHFDMFPTILNSLGACIEGDRLGFGTDLMSKKKTKLEELGLYKLNGEIAKPSRIYDNFYLTEYHSKNRNPNR